MTTPRQRRFLFAQVGWMLVTTAVLASANALTVENAVVASFVGLTVVTALTAPVHATVGWRQRLRWPLLGGAALFLAFVALRTLDKFLRAF